MTPQWPFFWLLMVRDTMHTCSCSCFPMGLHGLWQRIGHLAVKIVVCIIVPVCDECILWPWEENKMQWVSSLWWFLSCSQQLSWWCGKCTLGHPLVQSTVWSLLGLPICMIPSASLVWHGSWWCQLCVGGLGGHPILWSCWWHQGLPGCYQFGPAILGQKYLLEFVVQKHVGNRVVLIDPIHEDMDQHWLEGVGTNASNARAFCVLMPQHQTWCLCLQVHIQLSWMEAGKAASMHSVVI